MAGQRFSFGPYVLNADAGALLRDGEPVPVGYRGVLLLKAFLDRPGEVLTKSDLLDAAWQGAAVEEANLSVQIASLRKHLGQSPSGGEWIATVPRVGYRFLGTVEAGAPNAHDGMPVTKEMAKPSIAVLPFINLSDDRAQEYFADGIVEEIITALSRVRWLFVIARNSSFTYKGRTVDVKQVGRELGVRYVLEGSVRKANDRVRIAGQLIDTSTGANLWADRFDGELGDIFELQDRVTASVVAAIAPKLEQAEIERARRKPTASLDAYDYFLRGLAEFHQWTRASNNEALRLFHKAMELDPNFAGAYAMAARSYSQRKSGGWTTDNGREVAETARLARRAGELGRDDASALCSAGAALAFVAGDLDTAAVYIDSALALNPNLAWAWLSSALVRVWRGEPAVAIEHANRAMRLSPQDVQVFVMQFAIGLSHFLEGRFSEALTWAEMASRAQPDHVPSIALVAASSALIENRDTTRDAMARLDQLMPELRVSDLKGFVPIRRPEHFKLWADALRKAGLPE
jgi:TolB-like protein